MQTFNDQVMLDFLHITTIFILSNCITYVYGSFQAPVSHNIGKYLQGLGVAARACAGHAPGVCRAQ
jgi:hypothetical protein